MRVLRSCGERVRSKHFEVNFSAQEKVLWIHEV